ncbi:hypothetical protein ABT346_04865 [Micromonospora peucetia]|uniref:hypothetical protein n=1 Tax=Micromonospora peucetia TaxID=47871 RepID=UPI003316BD5A
MTDEQIKGADPVVAAGVEKQLQGADVPTPQRIVVLSLIHRPPQRIVNYVQNILRRGDEAHVFVSRIEHWEEAELDPRPHLYPLDRPEEQLLVRRAERALVFRAPKAISNAAGRLADKRWGRPLRRPAELMSRAQPKASGAIHKRLFMPPYRAFRPQLLAKQFDTALSSIDFDTVDLVVASDVYTVTLAARLARLHPDVPVTTALEL